MSKPWKHIPSETESPHTNIDLSITYPEEDIKVPVQCIHCEGTMDDYDASEFWEPSFTRFENCHKPVAPRMHRHMGVPRKHVELDGSMSDHSSTLYVCRRCGWWLAVERAILSAVKWQHWYITLVSPAVLKELDVSDVRLPIAEVRNYLIRRFNARSALHPRTFEETVGSVFKDHGYNAVVTGYSRDGGIDVILQGEEGDRIGVQVKRQQRSIQVEQIRAFLGALIVGGHTRGIFVSTAGYQKGSKILAKTCSEKHVPIELISPDKFFNMLEIAQLTNGTRPEHCGIDKRSPPNFVLHSDYHLNSL